ncbi:MAG TPA: His-Xaa-Ser system radical SAM maturase HxsB [Polyangiaceae bacterium]|nr:His-Xaa-Ser system radical SAM maturase HxsB [Polyangiaceae bacterium]
MNLTDLPHLDTSKAAFFRFRRIGEAVLLTNLEGEHLLLDEQEFVQFAQGSFDDSSSLHQRLRERNFLRAHYDQDRAAERLRARKRFLESGPNLHLVVVTLRCNETCVYCHASRANMAATHTDMTPELAERTVDLILQSTNPDVTIEFQGGEPLVNFPVVRHIIEYALEKNKAVGKTLEFTMVSNLSLMDDEKLEYLLDRRVQICTSVDGPEHLHDRQRKLPGLSAFRSSTHWIQRINDAYRERNLDPTLYHVEALLTTTRDTLPLWKEVVDTYSGLGCRALFLRPIDPFGWAEKTAHRVEYPRDEYLEFYRRAVDYVIELNRQGVEILERYAAIFLTKILTGEDPNFLDIRWPGGAGIGQLAYNYDGRIFTCDEGRMLGEAGDDTFVIGDVRTSKYRELMRHPTVRAVVLASNLDARPDCVNCTYQPYCGVPPVHSYKTQGTLFGRMRESSLCAVHKGIQDYLFGKIREADPEVMEIFRRWTTFRPREHFLHEGDQPQAAGA